VLDRAASARLGVDYPNGLGLADALTCVGLHRFGGRKCSWLAFRHSKYEYGVSQDEVEEPGSPATGFFAGMESWKSMEERDYFNETTEGRTHTLTCPKCGQQGEYKVTWVVRRKRAQLPRGADERDRAKFAKAQSYMVRRDEKLSCANMRCRKPFEISSLQSVAFLSD
jgi:adenine-specific DNA methylase